MGGRGDVCDPNCSSFGSSCFYILCVNKDFKTLSDLLTLMT